MGGKFQALSALTFIVLHKSSNMYYDKSHTKKEVHIMKQNIGKTDKMIRIVLGVVLIAVGLYYKSWWGIVGIIPLLTAGIGYCHLYTLLGISTCKK